MHIFSPETDNCPSWISGRERMTVENISWSISTKECCRPRRGLNPRPPGLQSDGASNWATEDFLKDVERRVGYHNIIWTAPCENLSSGICKQRRARSDYIYTCLLTKSLATAECMNGGLRPGWYFVHTQDGLNLRIFTHVRRHVFAWRGPYTVRNM